MNLSEIQALHAPYLDDVNTYSGFVHEHDASTRPLGVYHLIRLLADHGARSLGEFGTGFSSVCLRTWRQETGRNIQFTSIEHDAAWNGFMQGTLEKRGLPTEGFRILQEYKDESLMMSAPPFDAVFIDHGPTMADRWHDVPWIYTMIKPGGLMIFDDWWPGHMRAFRSTKRIIRILARMGLEWRVLEESRPASHDKAIAVVRKPLR